MSDEDLMKAAENVAEWLGRVLGTVTGWAIRALLVVTEEGWFYDKAEK